MSCKIDPSVKGDFAKCAFLFGMNMSEYLEILVGRELERMSQALMDGEQAPSDSRPQFTQVYEGLPPSGRVDRGKLSFPSPSLVISDTKVDQDLQEYTTVDPSKTVDLRTIIDMMRLELE